MFSISAPGPVQLPQEAKTEPRSFASFGLGAPITSKSTLVSSPTVPPPAAAKPKTAPAPVMAKRNSYQSMTTDGESVYESAAEDAGDDEDETPAPRAQPAAQQQPQASSQAQVQHDDDGSSDEEVDESKYQVYENERSARAGLNVGPPRVEKITHQPRHQDDDAASDVTETAPGRVRASDAASTISKRKSVRIVNPDSPTSPTSQAQAPAPITQDGLDYASREERDRAPSPEPARPASQWSSRIGNADISSDDEEDDGYKSAKKGLGRNSGNWESVTSKSANGGSGVKRSKSTKSKSSARG